MVVQPAETDVQGLIKIVVEMVEPLAHSKGLEITVAAADAPKQIITDPLRLQQVITNLLSNAIRYTESGLVRLECQTLPHQFWAIVISDSGVGISPEDQAHIFDPYVRAISSEQLQATDGTGLGLAIVSRLVKLMQGEIKLVSQPGVGSTFTVILPVDVNAKAKIEDGAGFE
jgi:signal transduction histidine kinase